MIHYFRCWVGFDKYVYRCTKCGRIQYVALQIGWFGIYLGKEPTTKEAIADMRRRHGHIDYGNPKPARDILNEEGER